MIEILRRVIAVLKDLGAFCDKACDCIHRPGTPMMPSYTRRAMLQLSAAVLPALALGSDAVRS